MHIPNDNTSRDVTLALSNEDAAATLALVEEALAARLTAHLAEAERLCTPTDDGTVPDNRTQAKRMVSELAALARAGRVRDELRRRIAEVAA